MNNSKKIVLFDIDHTIFDTESYIKNLYKKLSLELGFEDIEEFKKMADGHYANIRKRTKFLPPDFFLKKIIKSAKKPTDIKKLTALFWNKELFESAIYHDVDSTFKYLIENNFIIGIFSTGDLEHQSVKIESLNDYLADNHIYISKDKFEIIKDTIPSYKNYKAYILDDLPEILHEVKNHNKDFITVLIKRAGNKREILVPTNFAPDAEIVNLSELIDIIENKS